jgi:hypothetical protein
MTDAEREAAALIDGSSPESLDDTALLLARQRADDNRDDARYAQLSAEVNRRYRQLNDETRRKMPRWMTAP